MRLLVLSCHDVCRLCCRTSWFAEVAQPQRRSCDVQGTVAAALGIALLTPSVRQAFDLAQLAWNAFQVELCRVLACTGPPPACCLITSQRFLQNSTLMSA